MSTADEVLVERTGDEANTLEADSLQANAAPADAGETNAASDTPITVIEPRPGWKVIDLRELWRYRELLFFLTWRDVKVRYKQTLLGAAWAILQPVMMMVVFSIVLGRMANVSSGDFPYPVFVYAGLLPWTFFSTAISSAGNSVVGSERLITKVYFPRLAIPFASVGAALVDFGIAFSVLIALMIYYGIAPGVGIVFVPMLIALAALAALGVGTFLAALNVSYRDFRYVIPFLVQLWMFATPTVYMHTEDESDDTEQPAAVAQVAEAQGATETDRSPSDTNPAEIVNDAAGTDEVNAAPSDRQNREPDEGAVPDWVQGLLVLNPMTGLIAFFRASTLGGPLPWASLGYSAAIIAIVFVAGVFYFRRVEDSFADII